MFTGKLEKENFKGETKKRKRGWTLKVLFCGLLTVLLVGLASNISFAQTTFTWDGSTDSDWTDETNWDQSDGYPGDASNEDAVAVIDIETNIPSIPAGLTFGTLTINCDTDTDDLEVATLGALTLTTLNLQVAAASDTDTDDADLTLAGNLTVSNINITVAGAGDAVLAVATYSVLGSPTVAITTTDDGAGTITCSTGTLTLGAVTLTADNASLATGDAGITFTGAGTMTASSLTMTADPSADDGDAVLTGVGATITITGAVGITGVGAANGFAAITSAGTLSIGGNLTIADGGHATTGIASSGTVVFNGSAAQTITLTDDTEADYSDFQNLQISNTHASGVILANSLFVDGTLTVDANSLLDADTNDELITVGTTSSISGTVTVGTNDPSVGDTVTIASGGAITCNTTDAWTPGQTIIINGTLTWNCVTELALATLVVGSGGNAVLSSTGEISVVGTSSLSGTLTMSAAGTLDLNGDVTIAGTGGITVSAAGTLEVDDDIDNSAGGNVNMTAGTISFDGGDAAEYTVGSGTNTLNTTNISAATPLTISGSEGTLNIDGTLTPAAATADISGGSNVTVTFSASVDLSNNADLLLYGPVNFDSSATITLGTGTTTLGNSSNAITVDDDDSTTAVVLTLAGDGLITLAGDVYIGYGNDTTTDEITCAVGTITIIIGAGRTVTNEGILDLDGVTADKILIASSTVNTPWYLDNSDADAALQLTHLAVRDCTLTTNGSESSGTGVVNATGNSGWTDASSSSLFQNPIASGKRGLDDLAVGTFSEIASDTVNYQAYVSRNYDTAADEIGDVGTVGTNVFYIHDADADGTGDTIVDADNGDDIHGEDLDTALAWNSTDGDDFTGPAEAPKGEYYLYLWAIDELTTEKYVVVSDYPLNLSDIIVVEPLSLASTEDEVFTSYLIQWDDFDDDSTIDLRYSTQNDLTMLDYADNSTRISTVAASLTTDQYRWDCSGVGSDAGTVYYIYVVAINQSGASMDVSDGLTVRGIDFTAPADTGITANTATADSDSYDDQTENILSDNTYYHLGWTDYEDDIASNNLDAYVSQNLYTSVVDLRAAYSASSKTAFRIINGKNPGTDGSSDTGAEASLAANVSVAKWDLTTGYGDDETDPFPEGDYYVYIVADDNNGSDTDGDSENDTYDELVRAPGQVTVKHDPFFYTSNGNVTAAVTGTTTGNGAADGTTVLGAASLSTTNDYYNNAVITITSGTYSGESRIISDYTGASYTVTVSPAFSGQIATSVTYRIYNILSVSATADSGDDVDSPDTANVYWKGLDVDDAATVVLYAAISTTDYASAAAIEAGATQFSTGQAEYNSTGYDSSGNDLWDYYSASNLLAAGSYYVWAVMTDTSGDKAYKKSAGTITLSHSPEIRIDNPPASSVTRTTDKYYTLEWTDVDYDESGDIDIYFSTTSQLGGTVGGELTSVADRAAVLDYTKVTTSASVDEDDEDSDDRYLIDLLGVSSTEITDGSVYYLYTVMDVDDDDVPDAGYQSGPIVIEHQSFISVTTPSLDDMATSSYTVNWLQKWNNQTSVSMDVDLYYDTTNTKTLGNLDDNIGSTNAPDGIIELDVAMDGDDDGSRYDESRSIVWDDIVTADTDGADLNGSATTTIFFDTDLSGLGDDYYNGRRFIVTGGALSGESATIQDYVSSTGRFTLASALSSAMNDDESDQIESYSIYVPDGTYYIYAVLDANSDSKYNVTTAVTGTTDAAGSNTTLVDTSGLSTIDDFYNGCRITVTDTSNDAYGQSRVISDYEGDGVGGTAGTITISQAFLDSTGTAMTVGSGATFSISPLESSSVSVGTVTISNYTVGIDTPEDYHDVGDVFNVDLTIDTNAQALTAANVYIDFNTDTLELDNPSAPFCTIVSDTTDAAGTTTGTTVNGSSSLSSVDDYYNGSKIVITSGVCLGESRTITDYESSTNLCTVNPAFSAKVDTSVTFEINTPLSATNTTIGSWTVFVVENSGDNDDGELGLVVLSTVANATAFASTSAFVSVALKAKAAGNTELEYIFDETNNRMTLMIDDDGEEHIPHNGGSAHVRSSTAGTSSISGKVILQGYADDEYPEITFELRQPGVYGHDSSYTSAEDEDGDTIGIQLTPDDDGSFTLTQVPAGEYFLAAKAPHYLRGQNDDATPLEVRAGQNIDNVLIKGYDDANSDGDFADTGEEFDYLLAGDTETATYPEDNVVNAYDVTNLVNNFGETSAEALTAADINGDGAIDITDFGLLAANWGRNAIRPTSGAAGVGNSAPAADVSGSLLRIVGLPDVIYLGDEIDVEVVANGVYDATGFGFEVGFDADKVSLNSVQEGKFFTGETLFVSKELNAKDGKKLSIGSAAFDESAREGTLVNFKLVPTTVGDISLTLNDGKLITNNGSIIDVARKFVVKVIAKPAKSELLQNFPNPFNPETWIPFALKEDANVEIRIYNLSGQLVRTLELGHKPTAHYFSKDKAAYWNGRNDSGERVSSGVYFYHIDAGKFNAVKKMVILK